MPAGRGVSPTMFPCIVILPLPGLPLSSSPSCNRGIGMFRYNLKLLKAPARYVEKSSRRATASSWRAVATRAPCPRCGTSCPVSILDPSSIQWNLMNRRRKNRSHTFAPPTVTSMRRAQAVRDAKALGLPVADVLQQLENERRNTPTKPVRRKNSRPRRPSSSAR